MTTGFGARPRTLQAGSSIWQWCSSQAEKSFAVPAGIYLFAVAARLIVAFGLGVRDPARTEPVSIAVSLARYGVFGNPFCIETGPSAHCAPLYSFLLAPIYMIFGDTQTADLARIVFACLVTSLQYALLPAVSRALGMGTAVGILAGFTGALVPMQYSAEAMGNFEAYVAALFLMMAAIRTIGVIECGTLSRMEALRGGVWWGLGLLLSPNLLSLAVAYVALLFVRARRGLRPARIGILCATVCLVLVPWTVRNYYQFGALFFIRNNLGLELFVSNHHEAKVNFIENTTSPFFVRHHPHQSRQAAEQIKQIGEVQFNREKGAQAFDWISSHPKEFGILTLRHAVNFWFPNMPGTLMKTLLWITTTMAFAGFAIAWSQGRSATGLVACTWLGFPMIYYFTQNYTRYGHPMYWTLLLMASNLAVTTIRALLPRPATVGIARRESHEAESHEAEVEQCVS